MRHSRSSFSTIESLTPLCLFCFCCWTNVLVVRGTTRIAWWCIILVQSIAALSIFVCRIRHSNTCWRSCCCSCQLICWPFIRQLVVPLPRAPNVSSHDALGAAVAQVTVVSVVRRCGSSGCKSWDLGCWNIISAPHWVVGIPASDTLSWGRGQQERDHFHILVFHNWFK